MQIRRCLLLTLLAFVTSLAAAQTRYNPEAIRLNNRGVAQMGQQFPDRAGASFAQASEKDPALTQARINEGIALLALQKLDDASRILQQAIAKDPNSAQAWYNLGLTQRADNQTEQALASFQRAAKIDPKDADSYYFEGVCYQQLKQSDRSIVAFETALQQNPLHASAEFGLARSLQRAGRTAEAKDHFTRFQHLTGTKISSAISMAYGEQGHYSTVTPVEAPQAIQQAMIPVQLAEQPIVLSATVATSTGGACMLDVTGNGTTDVLLMQDGPQAIAALHRSASGSFETLNLAGTGLQARGRAVACAVGDYDGDGLNDLAVALDDRLLLFRNLGHGKFQDATAQSGLSQHNHPSGITFVDFDHDGDLDLLLTGSVLKPEDAPNVLWRNNGNGTFTDWTAAAGFGGSGKTAAAVLTDFNNDRAVDLAITGDGPSPLFYVNPREGKYPTQPLHPQANLPPSVGIAVLDYNKDGWMDMAVSYSGAPGFALWRNIESADHTGRRFEQVQLPLEGLQRGWGITPIDIDNDGWIDLAVIVDTAAGQQLRVFRNLGNGSFEDVSKTLGLDKIHLRSARGLIAADLNGDGTSGLIVTQSNAPPLFLRNVGANRNHSVRLDLTGYADNKTALGVKVEVYANGMWQKWELPGASGYQTQAAPQIVVGLGKAEGIDLLRILWPTGVLQDEIDLPRTKIIAMKEADRRGSSCPVLFVWDGQRYKFVTDVIGAAVVGHWIAPTRRNIANPDEWVKIDGADVSPTDGKVSVRFMEPMEEVNYIDQLRLIAVDHPESVEVNPDERFLDDPPFASGRVIATSGAFLPVGAWDGEGRDVLDVLSRADHRFASGFTAVPYDGFANLHALTLDLGAIDANAPLRLLMTGYINYFSATSLYAAWQSGLKAVSPYIEVQLADGTWQHVPGQVGFPAGLERTIVVDLSHKLPPGTHRIRLNTNLQIYWDQVLIDQSDHAPARVTEMPLSTAALHFRGYPKEIERASPGDLDYDYNRVSLTGPFQRERGSYTRMGDVTPLLRSIDNRFVIFGSGEEVAAEFETANLPALPAHWKRDYFFFADGFVKDMDWWEASPFTVSQLPFHDMSAYPYPNREHYPNDAGSLEYQLNWNDRFDSGEHVRSYRFNYQLLPSTPADDRSLQQTSGAQP